jgi:DNA-directed RNA polymerase subunit alpha
MSGLEGFAMPAAIKVDESTATATYARFTAEPWESGFGHTIGNALRRVLLSSLEGCAVSSVRIDGVAHEFSSIEDVVEDVAEIVLNLKKLRLQCDSEAELPRTVELYADKAGPVTAACVQEDGVVRVLNPDLVICTLDKDRPLRMEMEIDRGRGFRPAEENKREDHPIGVIPVDCIFSPVERVRYDVQACRVGNRTDFDRLELEIWTDGRVSPAEALSFSASLLRDHLRAFANNEPSAPGGVVGVAAPSLSGEDQEMVDCLMRPVSHLELSVRAENCLNTAQIRYLGELVGKSESEMLKFRNFGKKSLQEIKAKLAELGMTLGMVLKEEVVETFQRRLAEQNQED